MKFGPDQSLGSITWPAPVALNLHSNITQDFSTLGNFASVENNGNFRQYKKEAHISGPVGGMSNSKTEILALSLILSRYLEKIVSLILIKDHYKH